jgi:hypothetical protein
VKFIQFVDISFVLLTLTLQILCLETGSHALSVVVDYATTIYFALKEVIRQCSGGGVIVHRQFVAQFIRCLDKLQHCATWGNDKSDHKFLPFAEIRRFVHLW